jgi:hypothetical protein
LADRNKNKNYEPLKNNQIMNKQNLFKLLFVATVALASFSCGEKEEEEKTDITYLSAGKTGGIVYGEAITLTASSQGDVFLWTCSGGTLQGEGKSVQWKAPEKTGKYTVTVSNGKGSSQSKEMEVVGLYFWGFDKAAADWAYDGEHTTRYFTNGKLSVSSSHATESGSYSYKPANVVLPYSVKTLVAVNRAADGNANRTATFYVYFVPDESSDLCCIRFRIAPNLQLWRVDAGRTVGGSTTYTTIQTPLTKDIFAGNNQFHQIGVAITADKTFIIHVDGIELYRTDYLATDASSLALEKFSYVIQPELTFMIDDFCFVNDGTILE